MSYTQVFGGTTLYPSDVSYIAFALGGGTIQLEWPTENAASPYPAARIIDVFASGTPVIQLPDATRVGPGETILFNNLSSSISDFRLVDYDGVQLAKISAGTQWQIYLTDNTTAAGTWQVFHYGASTATVQASALAGYGLTVTSGTLSQSMPVTTFSSSRSVLTTDRAAAFVWEGTGAGALTLPSAVTAGNNFFISARNSGGGDLTIAAAGTELIDGLSTLSLRPGESTSVFTDGLAWYSLGLGKDAIFAFDYTSISVSAGTYTLAGSELNRIAYKFVGAISSDQYVVVPSTVQQYWVDNATTGAYSFYLQTSGGTPLLVPQGSRGIYYCNGTNMVDADTAGISLPINPASGGTGLTSYAVGDLIYASAPTTLSKLSDVATGNALISGGVGVAPSWGKITLTTHVSGTLPVANGGTGLTSYTANGVLYASGTTTLTTGSALTFNGTVLGVTGSVSIGTTSATYDLSFGGDNNRSIGLERRTLAGASGKQLGLVPGGATLGSTDQNGGNLFLQSGISTGSGSSFVVVYTHGGGASGTADTVAQERMRVDGLGNVTVGTGAINTTATDGFLYIPTCAGTPTGVPTAKTGLAPMVVDSTNNKLYVYISGAWRVMN